MVDRDVRAPVGVVAAVGLVVVAALDLVAVPRRRLPVVVPMWIPAIPPAMEIGVTRPHRLPRRGIREMVGIDDISRQVVVKCTMIPT